MCVNFPIRYKLEPRKVDPGLQWVKLTLENVGPDGLTGLDVRLNSLDTYNIGVSGVELYIPVLQSGEERLCAFQISANLTGEVYVTLDGWQKDQRFHWDSSGIWMTVGEEAAEMLDCEETLHSLTAGEGFAIELWTQPPDSPFVGPSDTLPDALSGEEIDRPVEVLPEAKIVHRVEEMSGEEGRLAAAPATGDVVTGVKSI